MDYTFPILVIGTCLLFAGAIFLVCIMLVRDGKEGMHGWEPPKTGIVCIEGLPGSGKSYLAVKKLYDFIQFDRRLIYTNLPLKLPVLRKLLRKSDGEYLTNYIVPLTKEHFFRSVARFADLTKHIELKASSMTARQAEDEFILEHGPEVPRPMNQREWIAYRALTQIDEKTAGLEWEYLATEDMCGLLPDGRLKPNAMAKGSAVCIDEVHKWCDQRIQKGEDPRLQDFVTMHRHGLFYVLLLTQNAMQMSISLRRNCEMYWRCLDMRNVSIFGPIKFPLPIFRYEEIPAGTLGESGDRSKVDPQRVWTELPWLDGGLVWRMYSSFTHAGSARALKRTIERSRQVAEGVHYNPNRTKERLMKASFRQKWSIRIAWGVLGMVGMGMMYYARPGGAAQASPIVPPATSSREDAPPPTPPGARASGLAASPVMYDGKEKAKAAAQPKVFKVTAVCDGFVVLSGGVIVRMGQSHEQITLQFSDGEMALIDGGARLDVGSDWVRRDTRPAADPAHDARAVDHATTQPRGTERRQWRPEPAEPEVGR